MDFSSFGVKELQDFLKERGVTCCIYKKQHLIRLCGLAEELSLEVLDGKDADAMVKEDYEQRRTVDDCGLTTILDPVQKCTTWTTNLAKIPDVESCDVMLYLLKYCSWSDSRLRKYKSDDGYKLYMTNHIHGVEFCPLLNVSYCYIKSTCIPQTRQNEAPYLVWVLISSNGEVISGGCSCVAYDVATEIRACTDLIIKQTLLFFDHLLHCFVIKRDYKAEEKREAMEHVNTVLHSCSALWIFVKGTETDILRHVLMLNANGINQRKQQSQLKQN